MHIYIYLITCNKIEEGGQQRLKMRVSYITFRNKWTENLLIWFKLVVI